MENASKALIIAGAILLVIAIIAIGIGIMNKTKGTIDEAKNQMSSLEIQMHNETFRQYESNGESYDKTFEEARECVRTIMTLNKKNENNRENIIYLSLKITKLDNIHDVREIQCVDDKTGSVNSSATSQRLVGDNTWGAEYWTIEKLYNHQDNFDRVINNNKHNHSSLYNIRTYTDEKGYIYHIKISKKSPVRIDEAIY